MLLQVACLSKIGVANIANERSAVIVFTEVVVDVAALGEGGSASLELAVEQQFDLLGLLVVNLFDSEPVSGNLLEDLGQLLLGLLEFLRKRALSKSDVLQIVVRAAFGWRCWLAVVVSFAPGCCLILRARSFLVIYFV